MKDCEQQNVQTNGIIGDEATLQEDILNHILAQIAPTITKLNFSMSHIAISTIAGGYSVRYNIKTNALSNKAEDRGSQVIFHLTTVKGLTVIEIPKNRLPFYDALDNQLTQLKSSGYIRIPYSTNNSLDFLEAVQADITNYLLSYPSDFSCCSRYEQCSNEGRCVHENQDMAAGCYYKRNLYTGKNFYKK